MINYYIYIAVTIIICNVLGQYFLVNTFESTIDAKHLLKFSDGYMLFIKGILYIIPFYFAFGMVLPIYAVLINFVLWDYLESHNIASHTLKQVFTYIVCSLYFIACA